jgi:hypothetical protein
MTADGAESHEVVPSRIERRNQSAFGGLRSIETRRCEVTQSGAVTHSRRFAGEARRRRIGFADPGMPVQPCAVARRRRFGSPEGAAPLADARNARGSSAIALNSSGMFVVPCSRSRESGRSSTSEPARFRRRPLRRTASPQLEKACGHRSAGLSRSSFSASRDHLTGSRPSCRGSWQGRCRSPGRRRRCPRRSRCTHPSCRGWWRGRCR